MDAAIEALALGAMSFLGFLVLKPFDARLRLSFGIFFAVYLALDGLITGWGLTHFKFIEGGYWNWSGKICSLVLSMIAIFALRMRTHATGLELPRRNVRMGCLLLIPLVSLGIVLGLVYKPEPPSAETLAFQLLMPGAAEELVYRGIAPALLLGLVRGRDAPATVPWTVICIAAVPYSAVHGLHYAHGAFAIDASSAAWTLSGGIVYGWLRFSSGSLLFPLLAHSLTNVAFQLTALLGVH